MIQDIFPHKPDIGFINCIPGDEDLLLFFDGSGRILADISGGIPRFAEYRDHHGAQAAFVFSAGGRRYFLALRECTYLPEGFEYYTIRALRDKCCAGTELFAAFTAFHLWKWYAENKFCGKCGSAADLKSDERALVCPQCGNVIYPRINPAVIVGVINGDRLLITRYKNGYAHNALVAGFTEIGETLEQTAEREVMEETGIRVRNIRYYRSQPWGMAQDILAGFFCEADGDCEIIMDKNELKYAGWVSRDEIVLQPNNLSLTNEMMSAFKYGRVSAHNNYQSLLEGTDNTRELGGHRTSDGKITAAGRILRSDAPVKYVSADDDALRSGGFTALIDMRTPEEREKKPCAYDNVNYDYHNFPIIEGSRMPASFEAVPEGYMRIAADKSMPYILKTIAETKNNVMYFCSAGKDRTGVVTAIILLACGVSRPQIIADFSLSREFLKKRLDKYLDAHPGTDSRIALANEAAMDKFLDMFFEKYGSIEEYFNKTGLSEKHIEMIREKLLCNENDIKRDE